MTDITPPQELVQQLYGLPQMRAIEKAYQAGADQELEVCCEWVAVESIAAATELRAARRSKPLSLKEQVLEALRAAMTARRPKPPSLKAQAIAELDDAVMRGDCITVSDALPTIRRALEALPND